MTERATALSVTATMRDDAAVSALAESLASACRRLHARGLLAGAEGNLSVRLADGTLLVTAAGVDKGTLTSDDVVRITRDGVVLAVVGDRRVSSEVGMHLACYAARPTAGAVVHAHPPVATGFATAGVPLPMDALAEVPAVIGPVALVPYGRPGSPALATAMHPWLQGHDTFLLAHHGVTVLGRTLEEALTRLESVEQAARIILSARLLGGELALPATEVAALASVRQTGEFPLVPATTPIGVSRVTTEAVRALVAERQRFDDWLAALVAKREATPERVFERVSADYSGRRRDVVGQLASHVDALMALESAQDAQRAELEQRIGVLEDQRAEAELRTLVGEFDDATWESTRAEVEAQLASLGTDRDGVETSLADVRMLLDECRRAAAELAPPAPPVVAPEPEIMLAEETPAVTVAENVGEPRRSPSGDPMGDVSDETAFTSAWLEAPMAASTHLADISSAESPLVEPLLVEPPLVETPPVEIPLIETPLVETPMVEPPLVEPPLVEPPLVEPPLVEPPLVEPPLVADPMSEFDDALSVFDDSPSPSTELAFLEPPPEPQATTPTPARRPAETFDDLAFLRSIMDPAAPDVPAEAAGAVDPKKTLRCNECQTLNYPSEWYCEKCGGELVNL